MKRLLQVSDLRTASRRMFLRSKKSFGFKKEGSYKNDSGNLLGEISRCWINRITKERLLRRDKVKSIEKKIIVRESRNITA